MKFKVCISSYIFMTFKLKLILLNHNVHCDSYEAPNLVSIKELALFVHILMKFHVEPLLIFKLRLILPDHVGRSGLNFLIKVSYEYFTLLYLKYFQAKFVSLHEISI
jgi:hypothetical protein